MTLRRYLRFIGILIKIKLARTMAFRFSFFSGSIADGTLFIIQLLSFFVIYGQVDSIGGWTRGQMLIFVGTFSMIDGLSTFYYSGIRRIPIFIRDGGLDHYLTKPGNALLRLTLEELDLSSLPLLLLSGGIIAWGVSVSSINVTPLLILAYSCFVLLMELLWYDMEIMWRIIPFFVISSYTLRQTEDDILTLNYKIPGVVYKGFFKVLFYFILPYGIMATVPTQVLTRTLTIPGLIQALGVVVVFTALTLWLWRFGLKHYKSASS